MISKTTIIGSIVTLGVWLAATSGEVAAQMAHENMSPLAEHPGQFHPLDQPLWMKGAVTVGGLGLIGLELWWFVLSKPQSRQATARGGIQDES